MRDRLVLYFNLALALSLTALLGARPLAAAEQTVWEIGRFDQSSVEFHARPNFLDPHENPIFTVGHSDPFKDWPADQPGSANTAAGGRPHPYAIVFDLANPPRGAFRLVVSVILRQPRVPRLQVEINGRTGLFYVCRACSTAWG